MTDFKRTFFDFCSLFLTFCKIGAISFGGGLAMMPMMQRELIEKRNWITEEELIDYYAIGQSTPGIIAVNVSTFVGVKRLGILGGIIGTLGMITPSLVIITILAYLINTIDEFPIVQAALKGVNVAVAALMTKVAINFSKKTIQSAFTFCVAFVAFLLIFAFKVPSFAVILIAILFGIIAHFIKNKKELQNDLKKSSEGAQ